MSDPQQLCEQVLEIVGDRAEAQVTASAGRAALTRFANSFIHQNVAEDTVSVLLKVAVPMGDGKTGVASSTTTRVDAGGLAALVDSTLAAARLRPPDPDWPGLAPPAGVTGPSGHHDPATEDADPEERASRVAAFVAASPETRAAGYCDTDGAHTAFANSAGQRAEGRASRATIDGIHQTDDSAGSAHQTSARLADLDAATAGSVAADRARRSSEPVAVDPGEYEVVLEPGCVAEMLVFLAWYGFNAKQVLEGQSGIRLGDAQFDPAFHLWDDATDPNHVGLAFDIDGTPKRHVGLVSGGTPVALVHDRRTAAKMGAESTGHAFPGSDAYGPFPSNIFMAPGEADGTAGLVSQVRQGLLVTNFNYVRILDPKTQVSTGLTRNGTFLIRDGEVCEGVQNLRFTQSFIDAFGPGNLLAAGRVADFADSEFGPGIVRCPPVRLASFRFTGNARG